MELIETDFGGLKMELFEMGNIRDSIEQSISQAFPYIEREVLHGVLVKILPQRGLIFSAEKK